MRHNASPPHARKALEFEQDLLWAVPCECHLSREKASPIAELANILNFSPAGGLHFPAINFDAEFHTVPHWNSQVIFAWIAVGSLVILDRPTLINTIDVHNTCTKPRRCELGILLALMNSEKPVTYGKKRRLLRRVPEVEAIRLQGGAV